MIPDKNQKIKKFVREVSSRVRTVIPKSEGRKKTISCGGCAQCRKK